MNLLMKRGNTWTAGAGKLRRTPIILSKKLKEVDKLVTLLNGKAGRDRTDATADSFLFSPFRVQQEVRRLKNSTWVFVGRSTG